MHSVRVCVCVCDVSTLIDYWISQYNSSPTPPSNVLLLPAMPTAQNYSAINFNHSMMIIITTELVLNHMSRSYFCCFQYKIPRNYQSTQSRQSSERGIIETQREREEHRTSNIEHRDRAAINQSSFHFAFIRLCHCNADSPGIFSSYTK